jgi:hypothetical protein
MKFKGEENTLIWESFRGKSNVLTERLDDMIEDDDMDDFDDGFEDDYGDDEFEMGDGGFDDDFEPESKSMQNIVMEVEPMGPVDSIEVNEVLVSELKKLAEYSQRLYDLRSSAEFEDWMASAITVASTYVSDVWHRLDAKADFANTGFEQSDNFNTIG